MDIAAVSHFLVMCAVITLKAGMVLGAFFVWACQYWHSASHKAETAEEAQ